MSQASREELTGIVLEIQRMSTEDGPGLRTTVFMKGCPMKCLWCHNPESISPQPQIQWIGMRCIGCKTCTRTCPRQALFIEEGGLQIDRTLCDGCGLCAEACPSTALELLGKRWEVHSLAKELLKDREYFKQSGGGITISGGEATLQWKFVSALVKILEEEGIHICMDTCGICRAEALDAILPYTDIVLFDLKEMDADLHRQFTQTSLSTVLASLEYLAEYIQSHNRSTEIWIRTPLIPGATAREDNILRIADQMSRLGDGKITRWDLLAFNNLCKDKYLRLGLDWPLKDTGLLPSELLEELTNTARRSGVSPDIVHSSGSTRMGEMNLTGSSQQLQPEVCGC